MIAYLGGIEVGAGEPSLGRDGYVNVTISLKPEWFSLGEVVNVPEPATCALRGKRFAAFGDGLIVERSYETHFPIVDTPRIKSARLTWSGPMQLEPMYGPWPEAAHGAAAVVPKEQGR